VPYLKALPLEDVTRIKIHGPVSHLVYNLIHPGIMLLSNQKLLLITSYVIIYFTTFLSFYENEQTLVALLPPVDIYIPTVYTSPPSPRYSRFPPFFPLDYGGPCSGGSNIKRGFWIANFGDPQKFKFPKPQINIAFPPTTRL